MALQAYLGYSTADTVTASALKKSVAILKANIEFVDHTKIAPGTPVTEAVVEFIERADIVFFLVSENFHSSKWCMEELNLADSLGKFIVPLLIGAGRLPERYDHLNPVVLRRSEEFSEMLRSDIQTLQELVLSTKVVRS